MNKLPIVLGTIVFIPAFLFLSFVMWSTLHHHREWSPLEIKASVEINQISGAVDLYKLDHGIYPENLDLLLGDYLIGDYLVKKFKDPWGNDYGYISNGKKLIIYTNGGPKYSDRQIFQGENGKYNKFKN